MAEISRAALFGKLNPVMFKAAEAAVTFCKLRGNPHVQLVHWLAQIVNLSTPDHLATLLDVEDGVAVVREGALGWPWVETIEAVPRSASAGGAAGVTP